MKIRITLPNNVAFASQLPAPSDAIDNRASLILPSRPNAGVISQNIRTGSSSSSELVTPINENTTSAHHAAAVEIGPSALNVPLPSTQTIASENVASRQTLTDIKLLKLVVTRKGKSPKSRPEARSAIIYSGIMVGGELVDFNNENLYLASVDEEGNPKMPFTEEHVLDGTARYQKNPVHPFEPDLQKYVYVQDWAWEQAQRHKIKFPSFDKIRGQWQFPDQARRPQSASGPTKNRQSHAIICCEEARSKDLDKNWSIYYAILNSFARTLIGKCPIDVVSFKRDSEKPVYTDYKYFFNTIGRFSVDQTRVLVRSFACNTLSGEDVVEISNSDCLKMCMENQVESMGNDEFLVRLPGVEFQCPDHARYKQICIYWVRYQPKLLERLEAMN